MEEEATAKKSYCWKDKSVRADPRGHAKQRGHGSHPMKVFSKHVAAGQKHGQRQSPSDTVNAVRRQPIRGRIHLQDCNDRRRGPGCCCPHHFVLTVISRECTRGEAPPEVVKLHHHSETRA